MRSLIALGSLALLAMGVVAAPSRAQDIGSELEHEYGVIGRDTPEGQQANEMLDRVVARMSKAVGIKVKSAKILGGKNRKLDQEINALALPDGRIYVMIGLINAVKDDKDGEAELAFVVGHEMTHVARKHSRRQMQGSLLGAIGGAVVAGVLGGGGEAIRTWSQIGSGVLGGHYSRTDEYDADRGGIAAMNKAGYPMEAAPAMMEKILTKYKDKNTPILAWFNSHPPSKNRILKLREVMNGIRSGALDDNGFPKKDDQPNGR